MKTLSSYNELSNVDLQSTNNNNLSQHEGKPCSVMREDYLTLADGTNRLSRNVSTKLPFYTASNPTRAQISSRFLTVRL
jgi:hypothetical protein